MGDCASRGGRTEWLDGISGPRGCDRLRRGRVSDRPPAPAPRRCGDHLREGYSAEYDVECRWRAMGAVQRLRAGPDDAGIRRTVRACGAALEAVVPGLALP